MPLVRCTSSRPLPRPFYPVVPALNALCWRSFGNGSSNLFFALHTRMKNRFHLALAIVREAAAAPAFKSGNGFTRSFTIYCGGQRSWHSFFPAGADLEGYSGGHRLRGLAGPGADHQRGFDAQPACKNAGGLNEWYENRSCGLNPPFP